MVEADEETYLQTANTFTPMNSGTRDTRLNWGMRSYRARRNDRSSCPKRLAHANRILLLDLIPKESCNSYVEGLSILSPGQYNTVGLCFACVDRLSDLQHVCIRQRNGRDEKMKAVAVFPQTREVRVIEQDAPRLTEPDHVKVRML